MLPEVREPIISCNPPHYICRRSKLPYPGEPNGRLDKDFWRQAEEIADFHDIEGDSKPRPLKKTSVKLLWDDTYLYIGARLEDDEIWATVTGRDEIIFVDNDFEIFLSPCRSSHRYYEIEMNAMNTVWDLLMDKPARDQANRIVSWDIRGLKSAVYIDGKLNDPSWPNHFWSIELLIPWFSLRECTPFECLPNHIIPDIGEQWRINFSRVEWQIDVVNGAYSKRINPATGKPFPEYNWVWAPTGVIDIHMPEMWGYVVFGNDTTGFTVPADAETERKLRKLYYRQRQYGAAHGFYTKDFNELKGQDEWPVIPQIDVTPSMFEISLPGSGGILHIRQDGFLWYDE
jgi:hypothetical protein